MEISLMTTAALRLAVVLITGSLPVGTAIPVYHGATLDLPGMKIDRAK